MEYIFEVTLPTLATTAVVAVNPSLQRILITTLRLTLEKRSITVAHL